MKALLCVFALALTAATAGPALAKSVSKSIAASVTIVTGNTVSAYVNGSALTTIVKRGDSHAAQPGGVLPQVRVSFDFPSTWYIVKHITWDKYKKHLTIDF